MRKPQKKFGPHPYPENIPIVFKKAKNHLQKARKQIFRKKGPQNASFQYEETKKKQKWLMMNF